MAKKVTKKALAAMIGNQGNISKEYALIVLNDLDDVLAELVRTNEPGVYIDNIGTFKRVEKKATNKFIPALGKVVEVPARVTVKMKPSQTLIERVW